MYRGGAVNVKYQVIVVLFIFMELPPPPPPQKKKKKKEKKVSTSASWEVDIIHPKGMCPFAICTLNQVSLLHFQNGYVI